MLQKKSPSRFAFCIISIFHRFAINFRSFQYYFYDDVDWIIEKTDEFLSRARSRDPEILGRGKNIGKIINQ